MSSQELKKTKKTKTKKTKKKQEPNPNLRNNSDTNANDNVANKYIRFRLTPIKIYGTLLLPTLDINVTLTPSFANFDLTSQTILQSSSQKINTFFYAFQGIIFSFMDLVLSSSAKGKNDNRFLVGFRKHFKSNNLHSDWLRAVQFFF